VDPFPRVYHLLPAMYDCLLINDRTEGSKIRLIFLYPPPHSFCEKDRQGRQFLILRPERIINAQKYERDSYPPPTQLTLSITHCSSTCNAPNNPRTRNKKSQQPPKPLILYNIQHVILAPTPRVPFTSDDPNTDQNNLPNPQSLIPAPKPNSPEHTSAQGGYTIPLTITSLQTSNSEQSGNDVMLSEGKGRKYSTIQRYIINQRPPN